jgi:hypothetical protein
MRSFVICTLQNIKVSKLRRMRWAGHVACMGIINACKIMVRKPDLKLGDLGVDGGNIKIDLKKIGYEYVDWIQLASERDQWQALVNMVKNPSGSIKGREFLEQPSVYLFVKVSAP